MRLAIFTSNSIRHKYFANTICGNIGDECMVVSEIAPPLAAGKQDNMPLPSLITEHFSLRDRTEAKLFADNDLFRRPTFPIPYKDINSDYAYSVIKRFSPELVIIFGSSIIKEPLLSILPYGKMLNLHLGLSPYYRGSGTNFWPFVNGELEYVGSTILCIDRGIDTGDIIAHVAPKIEIGDTVHTVGCKVIEESVKCFSMIIKAIKSGYQLLSEKQWVVEGKYYRKIDFNEEILEKYYQNLKKGLVENFVKNPKRPPREVSLTGLKP